MLHCKEQYGRMIEMKADQVNSWSKCGDMKDLLKESRIGWLSPENIKYTVIVFSLLKSIQCIFTYIIYLVLRGWNSFHFIDIWGSGKLCNMAKSIWTGCKIWTWKFNRNQQTYDERKPSKNFSVYKALWEIQSSVSLPLRNLYLVGKQAAKRWKVMIHDLNRNSSQWQKRCHKVALG